MMQQYASTSNEADNHIMPKPGKVKRENGRDQDQSTPAKNPRHSEINENNQKWECAICTAGFRFWNNLNAHVKRVHENTNETTHVNTKTQCGICQKSYSSNGNLQRHVRTAHSVDTVETVAAATTVLTKDKENLSHSKGKVPSIQPPSQVADTIERTVLNKDKENITKLAKNDHNLLGTLKTSLIQYQCMHCLRTEDTIDAAVYHAQVHLIQDALGKKISNQYKQAFDEQKKSVNNSSLIKITFDYKTLLKDTWFDMFQGLSIPLESETASLYKHTRCVKMNFDSRSTHEKQGKCVLLYQCGTCKLIVKPTKVQKHCDYNGACVEGGQGYKCQECQLSFYTSKALRRHRKKHENNQPLIVKIATFNNKDDVLFNNILKQISLSSVDDTHEDTELEKISRNPSTPENDVMEKKNVFQVPKCYDQSFSVKAGANIVSPEEKVSNDDNTRKDFLKNRNKVQAHKDTVEASKDSYSERIENGSKNAVTVRDSNNDSNDTKRQSPAQLKSKRSSGGVFTTKDEIIQKNSNDNYDNVAKEGIVGKNDQNDQSAFKRRRICCEDNTPAGILEADNRSQSTKDQRAHSRDNLEEKENFDQRNQEVQKDTGTTASKGAVNIPVSGESGAESSEYVSLNGNMAILHGSFNQMDLRFDSSRGKQCTGIAAVACAAFCVLDPNAWTKSIIDKIVVIGDKYYNHCIAARTLPAAEEVNPDYLAVTDLMPTIIFNKLSVPIAFDENTNLNGHIDNDNKGFPNLKNALKLFFRRHASGILTSNAMSVAVYCKTVGETYWLFDSHSRGPEGGPALGGAACCMRFSHLDDLHALLRRNLYVEPIGDPEGRDLRNNLNVFSLTSLGVRTGNE